MSELHTSVNQIEEYPEISIKECLIEGWEMFKKHWLVLTVASILTTLIMTIPVKINVFFSFLVLFITPPIIAGDTYIGLKAGRDDNPSLKDLFFGFSRYWYTIGYYSLIGIIIVIFMIPFTFFIDPSSFAQLNTNKSPILFFISTKDGFILTGAVLLFGIFALKYFMSMYLLVDTPKKKISELFRESRFLLEGYILKIVTFIIIGILFAILRELLLSLIPLKIVYDINEVDQMFESSSVFVVSFINLLITFLSGVYFSLVYVRFYEKLKIIKQKPPFTVTHDPF